MTDDFSDPFKDSNEDLEREQRRRDRAERRRARLAKRVQRSGRVPEPEVQVPPPAAEPAPAAPSPSASPQPPPQVPAEPAEPAAERADPSAWAARRPPVRTTPPGRTTYRRRRIAVMVVLLVLVVVGVFAALLYQPFHGQGSGRVTVRIPKGASASQIANLLDKKGVVSNATFFRLRLSLSGKSSEIEAGTYTLANDMSYGDAIDKLSIPPAQRTITVTIPEGYDRTQTAKLVRQDGLPGDYLAQTEHSKYLDPTGYGAKNPQNLEGFLFPATYEMKANATVDDLIQQQIAAFQQDFGGLSLKYAKSKHLTPYDILIIASMIEREAQNDSDRAKVAAVIYNRLHAGMYLGIDATIRFAENNYDNALTQSDLALDSPYNTRTNLGLPPGPISNPGLASLKAAAKPADVPYLYYVTKPGTCGKLTFATTDAEFQKAADAYNHARDAAGGNSPTTC